MSNDNYPDLQINVQAKVELEDNGFVWKVKVHLTGPDDIKEVISPVWPTREKATTEMLKYFIDVVDDKFGELIYED